MPFSISREIPSRIYSAEKHASLLKITANRDFEGIVKETVPSDLTVINPLIGQKFEKVTLVNSADNTASESGRMTVGLPFAGNFRQTQGFGDNETDPLLRKQYILFGTVGHDGVDFAIPQNTPVLAADSGVAVYADWYPYGKTIILKHPWGQSYYGHLSQFAILPNQFISKGEVIGYSGSTGLSTGPHLHFGIRLNDFDLANGYYGKIDPLLYLNNSTILSENQTKNIFWKVNLKTGQSVDLGYMFNAPDIAGTAYKLGPLELESDASSSSSAQINNITFSENRTFQVLSDSLPVKYLGFTSGTLDNTEIISQVVTNEDVPGAYNQLYLAVVASLPGFPVEKVEGLDLNWRQAAANCPDNAGSKLSFYYAVGSPPEDGKVTAHFVNGSKSKGSAAISVYRYSGIDPQSPVGNVICENSKDPVSDISANAKTTQKDSLLFTAIRGNSILNISESFIKRSQVQSGISDSSVKFITMDKSFSNINNEISISADFEIPSEFNLLSVEIIADGNKPKNRLRHGMWFDNQGSKQPFNF